LSSDLPAAASVASRAPGLPAHVAIIMDGNGRWAKQRLLSRINGHEKGAETVRMVVRTCREVRIPYLTLYAFSTENWQRPKAEVEALMRLLRRFLQAELPEMIGNDIRLNVIGCRERLPADVQKTLDDAIERTRANASLQLNLALSYGGRDDITRAARSLAAKAASGVIRPEDITEDILAAHLDTGAMPDPDLLIRTGGDMRVSNFLLWQIAYAEICVTPTLWPDFDRGQFLHILEEFRSRERRFGRTD
jgi:undecaprenyl diphosphate synthase